MKRFPLILYFISISQLFSQIVNEGTLKILPTTIVSLQDTYYNNTLGTHDNEGELYLNSDFINNGTTTNPTSGTTYFKSTVNTIQTISGITGGVNFYNMEVNVTGVDKKGVSVVDGFHLEVGNKVNLVSGDLRLVGQAQLVQSHIGANVNTTSGGSLLRDQQGISSVYGYNYWSSPVNNNSNSFSLNGGLYDGTDSNLNSFNPQQVLFNTGAPYNGLPASLDGSLNVVTPLYINNRWLYKYAPNTSGYAGWEQINKETPLLPGQGFTMKGTGLVGQNYVFKGLPNDGAYAFLINSGESTLLGNPYPSALDSEKFINDNLLILDKIEIWVDGGSNSHYLSNYLGGYSIQNLTGGVTPSVISSIAGVGTASGLIPKRYLAVGQGFFVQAISNGTINFNNSQRAFQIEDGINSNFYKTTNTKKQKSQTDVSDSFIRIGYEDPELFHRQLLLGFMPNSNADLNFNIGYDAIMADPREDELFYIIDNDLTKKYVIQGVGSYNNSYEFPIGIIITQAGNHTIMLDAVENFTDSVYIKDTSLNVTYNISEGSFALNLPPGQYLNRFKIVFMPVEALNLNEFDLNFFSVYSNNNNLIINNKNQIKLNRIVVFNMLGQKVVEISKNKLNKAQISLPFFYSNGMYLVFVESNKEKKTFKIIKQ